MNIRFEASSILNIVDVQTYYSLAAILLASSILLLPPDGSCLPLLLLEVVDPPLLLVGLLSLRPLPYWEMAAASSSFLSILHLHRPPCPLQLLFDPSHLQGQRPTFVVPQDYAHEVPCYGGSVDIPSRSPSPPLVVVGVSPCMDESLCLDVSQCVSKCLKVSQCVSKCLKVSQRVSSCLKLSQSVSMCFNVSHNVSGGGTLAISLCM